MSFRRHFDDIYNFSIHNDFRQEQDLRDLREAVLNAKNETQTHTTKEIIERAHALHRYVIGIRVLIKVHIRVFFVHKNTTRYMYYVFKIKYSHLFHSCPFIHNGSNNLIK